MCSDFLFDIFQPVQGFWFHSTFTDLLRGNWLAFATNDAVSVFCEGTECTSNIPVPPFCPSVTLFGVPLTISNYSCCVHLQFLCLFTVRGFETAMHRWLVIFRPFFRLVYLVDKLIGSLLVLRSSCSWSW